MCPVFWKVIVWNTILGGGDNSNKTIFRIQKRVIRPMI
jgi:hypothetical protein